MYLIQFIHLFVVRTYNFFGFLLFQLILRHSIPWELQLNFLTLTSRFNLFLLKKNCRKSYYVRKRLNIHTILYLRCDYIYFLIRFLISLYIRIKSRIDLPLWRNILDVRHIMFTTTIYKDCILPYLVLFETLKLRVLKIYFLCLIFIFRNTY